MKDKLVFAKGYGYRDYEKKLPVTPNTLYRIASNIKLFTTIAIGMLVEHEKLDWDKSIKNCVPSTEFYNSELNNTVTMRDMLSHRDRYFPSRSGLNQILPEKNYLEN